MSAAWIEWANGAAGAWAGMMFRAAWQGGVALLAAWVLAETVGRRSGRVQSWLWRIGFLKFAVCLVGVAPVMLPVLPAEPRPEDVLFSHLGSEAEGMGAAGRANRVHDEAVGTPAGSLEGRGAVTGEVPAMREERGVAVALSWEAWVMVLWAAGAAVGATRLSIAWKRTRSAIRRASPLNDGGGGRALERVAAALGVRRLPRLMEAGVESPVLAGLWRPVVLVPAGLAGRCSAEQWRALLAHELAHLKRRDLWWNWLCAGVGMVFWFHPLVWAARRRWMLAQEMACDALALRAAGAGAAEYGRLLVDLVAAGPARRALLGVGVAESAGTLRRRLVAMKTMRQWTNRYKAAVAGVIAVGAVVGVVPWRVVAQEGPRRSTTTAPARGTAAPEAPATRPGARGGTVQPPAALGTSVQRLQYQAVVRAPAVELRAPVEGVLERAAAAGARVKKGETVFVFQSREAALAVRTGESRLEFAVKTLERVKAQHTAAIASQEELERAQAEVNAVQQMLEGQRQRLADYEVRAPMDGVVTAHGLMAGAYVVRGAALATLVNTAEPYLAFYVPAADAGRLQVGEKVTFQAGEQAAPYEGEVTYVDPRVEESAGVVLVQASLLAAGDGLRAGMQGRVTIARP